MRTPFARSLYLGFSLLALACSSKDKIEGATGATPAPSAPAVTGNEQTSAGALMPSPPTADAGDATGALEPPLPVVENPNHDLLLSSAVPELAANKRLVYDMWRTLIEARDTDAGQQYFSEGYIQHNPNADTGRAGVLAFFSSLGAPLPVQDRVQAKLVSILAERDLVVIARVDARTEPRPYTTTWFDLFRIEGGLIAEHWDPAVLDNGATPRGYVPPATNPDQPSSVASNDPQLAANKQLVSDAWRTLLDAQQVEEAPRYLAEDYIQHNPLANTGLQGFLAFFRQFAQPRPVQPEIANFIQMVAEGDLVVLATARTYTDSAGDPYTSTWFDMFRVSDAKLAEHWDTQVIPIQ